MSELLVWLSNNPGIITTIVVLLGVLVISIVLMFVAGFTQGRELSLWPPKIGPLPDEQKSIKKENPPAAASAGDRPVTDLSGTWLCNDGAAYYIRQVDREIYWMGEPPSQPPPFCNVAYGIIASDEVRLQYADIPKGNNRNFGTLTLSVSNNGLRMNATVKNGKFGGSIWTKQIS